MMGNLTPVSFYEFVGDSWCVLFSHPADFMPVCTTELGATARLEPEWSKRGVKVIGLSVDSATDHERWIADINETQGPDYQMGPASLPRIVPASRVYDRQAQGIMEFGREGQMLTRIADTS
jgi:AhpC/TSA family